MFTLYFARTGNEDQLIKDISLTTAVAAGFFTTLLALAIPDITRIAVCDDQDNTTFDTCYRQRYIPLHKVLENFAAAMSALAADPYTNSPDKTSIHTALIDHLAQWIAGTQPETLLDLARIRAHVYTQRTGQNAFVYRDFLSYRDKDYDWISQDDYYNGHNTIKPDDIVHETQLGLCR